MAKAKHLRYIEFRGFQLEPGVLEPSTLPSWAGNAWNGVAMYCYNSLPTPSDGVGALKIFGCLKTAPAPIEVLESIYFAWVQLDGFGENLFEIIDQQTFLLEAIHKAIRETAPLLGLQLETFDNAKQMVYSSGFNHTYPIAKSTSSPNRKFKASIWYEYDNKVNTYLLVADSHGNETGRLLFAHISKDELGRVQWLSNEEVKITRKHNPGFWIYRIGDLSPTFYYPPAETGDPHAIYRHASMLLDGETILRDVEKGTELLRLAAQLGYKHAVKRLSSVNEITHSNNGGWPPILPLLNVPRR